MKDFFLFLYVLLVATWCSLRKIVCLFFFRHNFANCIFYNVKEMALHYKGNPEDPVGPWYESALPPRYAFCMRDVAHQSIPAEILGRGGANKNMFTLFEEYIPIKGLVQLLGNK